MLLSYNQLMSEVVEKGVIAMPIDGQPVLTNIPHGRVNSASIDISLGPIIKAEDVRGLPCTVSLRDRNPLNTSLYDLRQFESFTLGPGEFILAQSAEIFNLPPHISCEYVLKSSMARIGLEHLTAGWCDAGWHGSVLTLELKNVTRNHRIALRLGDLIGQMKFFMHEPVPEDRSYAARGRYNKDLETTTIKK